MISGSDKTDAQVKTVTVTEQGQGGHSYQTSKGYQDWDPEHAPHFASTGLVYPTNSKGGDQDDDMDFDMTLAPSNATPTGRPAASPTALAADE